MRQQGFSFLVLTLLLSSKAFHFWFSLFIGFTAGLGPFLFEVLPCFPNLIPDNKAYLIPFKQIYL